MGAVMVCIAVATLGIDVGWQRLPDGGMEYIIQVEPQTLDALGSGQTVQSDIPSNAGDIRAFRIVVGTKKLPHETPLGGPPRVDVLKPPASPPESPPTAPRSLSLDPATKPLPEQPAAFTQPTAMPSDASKSTLPSAPPPHEPSQPWLPLTFALLGLFASFGANLFLGWIVWDLRQRCRALLTPSAGS
jgi:hypothetical protein